MKPRQMHQDFVYQIIMIFQFIFVFSLTISRIIVYLSLQIF